MELLKSLVYSLPFKIAAGLAGTIGFLLLLLMGLSSLIYDAAEIIIEDKMDRVKYLDDWKKLDFSVFEKRNSLIVGSALNIGKQPEVCLGFVSRYSWSLCTVREAEAVLQENVTFGG